MKKIITLLVLVNFILVSCWKTEEVVVDEVKPKFVKSQTVTEKWFSEDLKLAWKVVALQETTISPLSSWVVNSVNVNVWDKVKSWDILATIDTRSNLTNINLNNAVNTYNNTVSVYNSTKESLEKSLDTAKLQYDNAIISRDNIYSSTQKQLELAQAQLESVITQKDNTSKTVSSSVALAQESLKNAELNLENFEKNYNETLNTLNIKKTSLIENLSVSMDNSIAINDWALNLIDNILWVTDLNKNQNDAFEIYISAKNTLLKTQAESIFKEANILFESFKSKYNSSLSNEEILALYSDNLKLNDKMVNLFEKMIAVLDNSTVWWTFTDSTLATYKTSVRTYQTQVLWLKSTLVWLNNSLKDVDNSISSTKTSLDTQKATLLQSINIAKATLENTKASTNSSIDSISSTENTTKIQLESTIESIKSSRDSVDNAVKIAQNQYESAKANYNSQLSSIKSQLDNASWQKNSLNQQLDNSQIRAPFDWVIVSKNIEIWSSVSQQSPAFSIASSTQKIIKMDINSDNVKYLQVWKEVKLSKNSYTSTGTISLVWASADPNTKMFKIEITFSNKDFNENISLWDFVDVYVQKELWGEKFITVPFSSIMVWSNDSYSIYVIWKGNLVEERKVSIWSSNSTEVIITSWLNIWDKVITSWALNISVWDKVSEEEQKN